MSESLLSELELRRLVEKKLEYLSDEIKLNLKNLENLSNPIFDNLIALIGYLLNQFDSSDVLVKLENVYTNGHNELNDAEKNI